MASVSPMLLAVQLFDILFITYCCTVGVQFGECCDASGECRGDNVAVCSPERVHNVPHPPAFRLPTRQLDRQRQHTGQYSLI